MGKHVQAARLLGGAIKDEVSDKVAFCKGSFKNFAREESPVASQDKIFLRLL